MLKGLDDNVKLELITLLSSSINLPEIDVKKKASERFEAALKRFHKDWGGEGSAMDIARELRQGAEMVRDVDTW